MLTTVRNEVAQLLGFNDKVLVASGGGSNSPNWRQMIAGIMVTKWYALWKATPDPIHAAQYNPIYQEYLLELQRQYPQVEIGRH